MKVLQDHNIRQNMIQASQSCMLRAIVGTVRRDAWPGRLDAVEPGGEELQRLNDMILLKRSMLEALPALTVQE